MKTPVAFIIFNRYEQTRRVFEMIRKVKPEKLLVISDGPSHDKVRAIIDTVDWPCTVLKNYSETNMGCRKRLSSGLTWVFEQVDRAIILEDDCLPNESFFSFCEELLEKYKDDEEVMHISGNFFQKKPIENSHYFSSIPHIWGWASWRRAWKYYDVDLKDWPNNTSLKEKLPGAVYEYWSTVWKQYYENKINSWDGQWMYTCLSRNGLCITPTKNLVSNIGFGATGTHTKNKDSIFANMKTDEIEFPLIHPERKILTKADMFTWKQNFGIDRTWKQIILGNFRRRLPKIYMLFRHVFHRIFRFN